MKNMKSNMLAVILAVAVLWCTNLFAAFTPVNPVIDWTHFLDKSSISTMKNDGRYQVIYNAGSFYRWYEGYDLTSPYLDVVGQLHSQYIPTAKLRMKAPKTVQIECYTVLSTSSTSTVVPVKLRTINGMPFNTVDNTATDRVTNIEYAADIDKWVAIPARYTIVAGSSWRTMNIAGMPFALTATYNIKFNTKLICRSVGDGKTTITFDSLAGFYQLSVGNVI